MTLILKLDVTGRAIGWLTADDGAAPCCRGLVAWMG